MNQNLSAAARNELIKVVRQLESALASARYALALLNRSEQS